MKKRRFREDIDGKERGVEMRRAGNRGGLRGDGWEGEESGVERRWMGRREGLKGEGQEIEGG